MDEDELISEAIESRLRELRVACPGRIESYDATKQRASIRLQLSFYMPTTDGLQEAQDHGVIQNVPICFPQGGGYFCAFPMAKGDPVMVVFSDVSIGAWLAKGQPTEPGVEDIHGLGGAVAFPAGPQPSGSPLQSAGGANMRLGKDGTDSAQIEFTPNEIHLGVGASKGVARDGDAVSMGQFIVMGVGTAFTGINWIPPGGGAPVPLPITTPTGTELSAKITGHSSKVKAED